MAEGGPPLRPRFFLDEEKNSSFLTKLEERTSVPSDAERQSAAAIRAVLVEDEDDMENSPAADAEEQTSHVVDLGDRPHPSADSATKPAATFWTRLQTGWSDFEDRLADWFGLDQSKYQWAVDEFLERQLAGDNPTPKANVAGLQMQNIQEQTMQRDSRASNLQDD